MRLRSALPKALLLLCAALAARSETLFGTVRESASGTPLASVEIRVWTRGAHDVIAEIETDNEGKFEVPDLTAGEYRIEAAKPNYTTNSLRVSLRSDSTPINLSLIRLGAISGQVSDQPGRAVTDAYVFAIRSHESIHERAYAHVDSEGRFRIHNLAPGQYLLAVSYGASTMAVGSSGSVHVSESVGSGTLFYPDNAHPKPFIVTGGEEFGSTDFVIAHGTLSTVSGRVETAAPANATGRFWMTLTDPKLHGISIATAEAATDGAFRFDGISPGSYTLLASGPSNARGPWGGIPGPEPLFGRAAISVGGDNIDNISIPVQPGRSVGFVLSTPPGLESRMCAASAKVTLTPIEDWGSSLETNIELQSGHEKKIEHLAPGQYRVTTKIAGDQCFGEKEMIVDLAQPPDRPIQVMTVPASSIRGKLSGAANPGAYSVTLFDPDSTGDKTMRQAIPDAESRFEFGGLHPGRYGLAVRTSRSTESTIDVEVKPGTVANVELTIAPEASPQ